MSVERGLALLFGLIVLCLVWAALYAHPTADDYCYAVLASEQGSIWASILREYQTWGGRYAAVGAMSGIALHMDLIRTFSAICVALISIWMLAFGCCFGSLGALVGLRRGVRPWAALSFCLFVGLLPSIPQTFYWMAGGVTYTGGYAGLLLVTALMMQLTRASLSGARLAALSLVAAVLVLGVAGFQETATALLVGVLATGALVCAREGSRRWALWLAAMLIAIGGLAIVAMAPGNAVRASRFAGGGSPWLAPVFGLGNGVAALLLAFLCMYLLTAHAWLRPLMNRLIEDTSLALARLHPHSRILIGLAIVGAFCGVFVPNYWVTGLYPQARTLGILPLLAVTTWVPALALARCWGWLGELRLPSLTSSPREGTIVAAAILLAFLLTPNVRELVRDAVRYGPRFDRELRDRYALISAAQREGLEILNVKALRETPHTLFVSDIGRDPRQWRNRCMKEFYGFSKIRALPRHEFEKIGPTGRVVDPGDLPCGLTVAQASGRKAIAPLQQLCLQAELSPDPEGYRRALRELAAAASESAETPSLPDRTPDAQP